ncbi:hypothetical protein HP425_26175, partial [Brevibacillus sp. HD1.4A]|nr:hypothetical protein [Brevibacillus sp. HD1.4A]
MRHNRWIKKIASVVLTSSLLMPNIAVAEANLLPKQAASRAADESATTKKWLSAYQAALQAGAGAKEKQPDEQPTYTKAEVMKLEWGPLSAESVWQLYQTGDRKLLQLAAYVHPQLDQFLSHNEQVDKYQWLDEAFQKKMDGLTAAEKKQLAAYAPQVVALHEKGKEVAAAKKALSPAGKAQATESAASATQAASALASIPD